MFGAETSASSSDLILCTLYLTRLPIESLECSYIVHTFTKVSQRIKIVRDSSLFSKRSRAFHLYPSVCAISRDPCREHGTRRAKPFDYRPATAGIVDYQFGMQAIPVRIYRPIMLISRQQRIGPTRKIINLSPFHRFR